MTKVKRFQFADPERRVHNEKKLLGRRYWTAENTSVDTGLSSHDIETTEQNMADRSQKASEQIKELQVFTYEELEDATRKFSAWNFIGEGGFGCVYKGCVRLTKSNGGEMKEVAIKQLNQTGLQGNKEWLSEINVLGGVDHPNLVKLIGYCSEDNERGKHLLLVYELMHNRSLDRHLFGRVQSVLSWKSRLSIALGAARGLAYLHEGMEFQVIFRDMKTSNILLDLNFDAKLSDFGFAREGPSLGRTHVTTAVLGTVGYAAPEYVQTGHLTAKSDVWSFGVVLLELLTGRRAIDMKRPRNEQILMYWVKPFMSDGRRFPQMLDPRLEGKYSLKAAEKIAILASQCLQANSNLRPNMSNIVERLSVILEKEAPLAAKTKRWSFKGLAKFFHVQNGLSGCRKL